MAFAITPSFQFHNGSIRSQRDEIVVGIRRGFQFHNGSIRSLSEVRPRRDDLRFNSTMVRLEVRRSAARRSGRSGAGCFNSTMVRLEGPSPARSPLRPARFQFHNGSIRRRPANWHPYQSGGMFQFHNGSIRRRRLTWKSKPLRLPCVSIPQWFD